MDGNEPISRRDVLRGRLFKGLARSVTGGLERAAGAMGELARTTTDQQRMSPLPLPVLHRPPGAIEEIAFVARCSKCDECVRACPVDAIIHAPPTMGKAAGTPIIDPIGAACVMCQDMACITACQAHGSGVLDPHLPKKMGTARVAPSACIAFRGESCRVCVDECPVDGAIALQNGVPRIDTESCTGCGVCQNVCPAPVNAIVLTPVRDRPPART